MTPPPHTIIGPTSSNFPCSPHSAQYNCRKSTKAGTSYLHGYDGQRQTVLARLRQIDSSFFKAEKHSPTTDGMPRMCTTSEKHGGRNQDGYEQHGEYRTPNSKTVVVLTIFLSRCCTPIQEANYARSIIIPAPSV